MPTIEPVALESANAEQRMILEVLRSKMGRVPNIYTTIAHSPATLEAMLAYHQGLKKGSLSPRESEAIALAVAEKNACEYCLAAHTVTSKMQHISEEEIREFRSGKSTDAKLDALLKLAIGINETKGFPSEKTIENFRKVGYSDAAMVEVVAWVAYNIFTNYINSVAETEVDFPKVPALK